MASNSGGIGFLVVFGLVALAYSNGGCESLTTTDADGPDGDGGFEFGVGDEDVDTAPGSGICDGVVVVESASAAAPVPADTGSLATSDSAACQMGTDHGEEEAVAVLQNALVHCHGQAVTIDGEYGTETAAAVAAVQRASGVVDDGTYGPVTYQAMRWPTTSTAQATASGTGCVAGGSEAAGVDSGTSSLPATR